MGKYLKGEKKATGMTYFYNSTYYFSSFLFLSSFSEREAYWLRAVVSKRLIKQLS